MTTEREQMISWGYSAAAIAMSEGHRSGSVEYYKVIEEINGPIEPGCRRCGAAWCFGTGDCNCSED